MLARREFLMLAHTLADKHKIAGYYLSQKLDGCRCFWDGGISRGLPTSSVPWSNITNPKTGQPKVKIKPFATGLWSRYANPIIAPDWFLNTLPCCPLDGELWAGRENFQKVMSTVRRDKPVDEQWKEIQYGIFGTPNIWAVMQDGEIKNPSFRRTINKSEIELWIKNRDRELLNNYIFLEGNPVFSAELAHLGEWIDTASDTHFLIKQTKLPLDEYHARQIVQYEKEIEIGKGGEGVFLRCPDSTWAPKKVHTSLKCKGSFDDEGIVVGFTSGRKTDKGSKLLGLIGAIVLDYKGKRLELSGMTDEERQFETKNMSEVASRHPGEQMSSGFQGRYFKVGDKITFTYFELSDDGIPKNARYFRKRS